MPLMRYHIRSEYGLADPELYRAADKDDPEALLEGVAMAGLVGILRQLGDLAEFASEMFYDLHEEVIGTAARGHSLTARLQQLEAGLPSIEKALLSQTDHSPFFSNTGVDWRSNVQLEKSLITHGDLPRCVMNGYKECRGPPQLFLLDKFDVAGAGACLKRYTDPSLFRLETPSSEASWVDILKEKKSQKAKKRGARWKNRGTHRIIPTSSAKLHELFLEDCVQGVHANPARLVNLKTRKLDGYSLISRSGESYMEKFVQTYERIASCPKLLTWDMDDATVSVTAMPEVVSTMDVAEKSSQGTETEVSSLDEQENVLKYDLNGDLTERDTETTSCDEAEGTASVVPDKIVTNDLRANLNEVTKRLPGRSYSEDLTSEVENYVDAPATMESETDTETDADSHIDEEKMEDSPQFSDSQSLGNTSASENKRGSILRWKSRFPRSDMESVSTKNDSSDREKAAECLPSTGGCKSERMDISSDVMEAQGSDNHELDSVSGSGIGHQAPCASHCASSSPRSVSQTVESLLPIIQSLAPEIDETDESRMSPVDSSTSCTRVDVKDPSFPSGALLAGLPFEGNRYENSTEKSRMENLPNDRDTKAADPITAVDVHLNNAIDGEGENGEATRPSYLEDNEIVPEKELAVSDNGADTPEGVDDVHLSSSVVLDDNDLPPLQTSQNQSDTDPAIMSPYHTNLLNTCVDSSFPLPQSVEVLEPSPEHILSDEAFLHSECVAPSAGEATNPTQTLNPECTYPRLGLIPEKPHPSLEEMPPLPPLPPMQWWIGKVQYCPSTASLGETDETLKSSLPTPPVDSSSGAQRIQSVDPAVLLLTMPEMELNPDSESEEASICVADDTVQSHEVEECPEEETSHVRPAVDRDINEEERGPTSRGPGDADQCPDDCESTDAEEKEERAEPSSSSVKKIHSGSRGEDAMWPVNAFDVVPTLDYEKPNDIFPTVKIPQPRSLLVDAVAAHDKNTMRKASKRNVRPAIRSTEEEEEEKNWLLTQIRNTTLNLKPATKTRPNIQVGPTTNLKVAAMLEKASTIRQAMAGTSDDDSDTWSDS